MSNNFSNYAQFGIHNDIERFAFVGWFMFVVVSSFVGDTIILIASIKYNAFRLHRTVVVYIQHIAVCDLLNSAGNLFPAVVSIIYNRRGSSEVLKFTSFFVNYLSAAASSALISAMTLGKLLHIRFPFRTRSWTRKKAHRLCIGLWIYSLGMPALHLFVDKDDVTFDYRVYLYNYKYSVRLWEVLMPIAIVIFIFLPNICIVVSTILILKDARKVVRRSRKNLRWQGSMAVVFTAIIYTVSFFPITIYFIAAPLVVAEPFHKEYYRICEALLYTNVLANFFVYSVTINGFRDFLKMKFWLLVSFVRRSHQCKYDTISLSSFERCSFEISREKCYLITITINPL